MGRLTRRKVALGGLLVAGLCMLLLSRSVHAADAPLEGIWMGTLNASGFELRLVLHVSADEKNALTATLDSPDQGTKGMTVDSVLVDAGKVRLELKAIAANFEGLLSEDGQTISGTWTQGPVKLPIALKRQEKEPTFNRPQEPKRPLPYREEEVTYENSAAGVKLGGTLTLPDAKRPVPAVLLITGSGAQDRDESLLGHRPFFVLSDYLTRQGIATLRVDDRGVNKSTGDPNASTTSDFADDALAGVAYLRSRPEIDPKRIGLCGHSEGGLVAPLAASRSSDVAFVVMLAGSAVVGEQILYRQGELIAKASGVDPLGVAVTRMTQQKLFKIMKDSGDPKARAARLKKELVAMHAAEQGEGADPLAVASQVEMQLMQLTSPWFQYFLTYDPLPALKKVRCPILAINGEHDLQVDPKQNLPVIETTLRETGHADFKIIELPGLNHLFQHSETGAIGEYGKIDETFAPEALEVVATWIRQHTGLGRDSK